MLSTLLKLGRVSNLPTVWSNTLAGTMLAGTFVLEPGSLWLLLAMTLAYIGGMFLNDAYDVKIDTIERPERPIPSGKISGNTVFLLGYAMLLASVGLVLFAASRSEGITHYAAASALLLAMCIILYNVWHKQNPFSPIIMGFCRMFVYITAGFTVAQLPSGVLFIGAGVTLCYLIGLTYIAKHENSKGTFTLWPVAFLTVPIAFGLYHSLHSVPTFCFTLLFSAWLAYSIQFIVNPRKRNIPQAVVGMIAGISLLDAIYISSIGAPYLAFFAVAAFLLTLFFQQYVAGT